jgi:septal ring-binding cell division protein DamX
MRSVTHKNYFKIFIPIFIISFASTVMASTIKDGLKALENNRVEDAVKIWADLAATGNNSAKFNLASHYEHGVGTDQNQALATKWFKSATRSGLVEAYLHFNKNALAAANGVTLKFDVPPTEWLEQQDKDLYTVQLASSRSEALIKKYYNENDIKSEGGYYHYVRDGVDRYALVFGVYKSIAAANAAIENFPPKLRSKKPWVRKIQSLQKISQK